MSQTLLADWHAHYVLRPWGGGVQDERLAYLLANLVQALTGGKLKRPPKPDPDRVPWTTADFLVDRMPRRPAEGPHATRRVGTLEAAPKRRGRSATPPEQPMTPAETVRYLAAVLGVPPQAVAHVRDG